MSPAPSPIHIGDSPDSKLAIQQVGGYEKAVSGIGSDSEMAWLGSYEVTPSKRAKRLGLQRIS